MASPLRTLFERFFPSAKEPRVIFGGLDTSGKTTLLYLLKLGEVVTTVPSMGFNVETTAVPTASGRELQIVGWDVGFGCGGPRFARVMMSHYLQNTNAIIWMVDSADKERLTESVEFLQDTLRECDNNLKNGGNDPLSYPIPILM